MVPTREIFWNIQFGEILYLLAAIAVGILVYALYRRYKLWRLGKPDNKFDHLGMRLWAFIVAGIVDGIFHRKFFGVANGLGHRNLSTMDFQPKELYPGSMHFLIFIGCIVFLLGAFLDFISHYFFHFMKGGVYLGTSLAVDVFGIFVVIGVALALIRRYIQKPDRLQTITDDLMFLLLILFVVVSGFVVEGLRIAATELKTTPDWALWSPGGFILAKAFSGLSQATLLTWHRVMWWLHVVITLGGATYLALRFYRLLHIFVSPLNVFCRSLTPRGVLKPIDLEKAETFGVSKIEDFTWKQLLDLDACTSCGRCQDNCPAYLSGKPLSPKTINENLRRLMEMTPKLVKAEAANPESKRQALIGEVVTEDEIWNCTTCFACQEVCPVWIEPMVKLIDLRRNLVLDKASVPETGEGALKSIESRGHPWRGTTLSRTDWAEGLDIKTLAEDSAIDILYWVGCTSALEERSVKVAQAIAKILKLAGIKFGILGTEESCCGDPARRLGNEYLFQLQAQSNIELFKGYGIKKIITGCPHCYNTIKHDYPQFGGEFQVIHHTEFIAKLLQESKLEIIKSARGVLTYHDACYLGRYNYIFEPPRQILNSMPDISFVELPRSRERGFCCGAGGGHLWLEEQRAGRRINEMRTEQVIETKAQIVATACPYCLQMFEDGIKAKAAEESLKARDIAELVAESAIYRPYSTKNTSSKP